jgi:WD40 repeat protein
MGRITRFLLYVMMMLYCGVVIAVAAEPPAEPILRIDPGMHTAHIRRIATDAAGRFLVTASDDKSLRVWELPAGRLIRTIRPPAGEGNEGKLFSVALSPDGRCIAAGGWTQFNNGEDTPAPDRHTIYLFDRITGDMTGRITVVPAVIGHLAFSPDGRWLAATLGGSNGIRIYRTSDLSLAAEDKEYGSDSYSAHFSRDGRLVTTSDDGFVRLYKAGPAGWGPRSGLTVSLSPRYKVKAPDGENPFSARFSPDGTKIAVGYDDTAHVTIITGKDLSSTVTLAGSPDNGNLCSIAWSLDGRFLYAGGKYGNIDNPLRRWSNGGRGAFSDIPGSHDTIMDLSPLPNGGVAFGSGDPAFGTLSSKGERTLFVPTANADFRANYEGFLLAPDGSKIRFGFELFGNAPALFDLATRQLTLDSSATGLTAPITKLPGVVVTEWEETCNPKLNGAPLKLSDYEMSRSLALAPDGNSFVLGADWNLRCFDRKGIELWPEPVPVPATAWGVNIPTNGKIVVATFGDGTIRWYRLKDGKELLAFFPHADRKRWVLWSPSGYYDASVGGEDLIGWQVNRGKEKAADFFPASRFRDTYYRPDIVARVLTTLDEEDAVRQANAIRGIAKGAPAIKDILPPVIEIIEPADGNISAQDRNVTIRYKVRAPANAPVTAVNARVNARPLPTETPKGGEGKPGEGEITVTIPEEDCEIALFAENTNALSTPAIIRVKWLGKASTAGVKPRLIILAVGIGKYNEAQLKLNYAAKDADDFFATFKQQEGVHYSKVVPYVITDSNAKKDDILDALDWLKKQESTNKDIVAIFLSGHGVIDKAGFYYFLPQNAISDKLTRTGLELSSIKNTVSHLQGKVILFLDTCHAGNVDLNGIINTLTGTGTGVVVFASSTGSQQSLERDDWQNGAFTKALVEGLDGKADYKGKVTITSLDLYVSERVKELTNERQTPVVGKPTTIPDFSIARKK